MPYYPCKVIDPNILALPTPSEASGAIARFNTDLTENLLSAVAEFSASQASGTPTPSVPIPIVGVDKVNATRCGKNLLDESERTDLTNNIQFYNANGLMLKAGTYTWSTSETINWYVVDFVTTTTLFTKYNSSFFTFTLNEDTRVKFNTYKVGIDHNDKFQLERGSTATDFEPYNGTTALINLGGTYYGGSVDAVTGKITLTHQGLTFTGSENWSYHSSGFFYTTTQITNYRTNNAVIASNGIKLRLVSDGTYAVIRIYVSDNTDYIDSSTNMQTIMTNGTQFVYELATPETEYASNTAEIPTINGFNQVYADTGDVAVKYFETVGHKI